ncbi:hypothetical protein, partial [Treponema sp. R6D11]
NICMKVSNFGRIKLENDMNEIINIEKMVQKKEKNGLKFNYPVLVGDDFFTIVHRLVAETFPKRLKTDPDLNFNIYKYVHHVDGNCFNNNENNLLWVTPYQHALIHPYLRKNFLNKTY